MFVTRLAEKHTAWAKHLNMLLKQSTVVLCSKIQFISIYIIYINFELRSVTTSSDRPRNNTDCTSCCIKYLANTSMFLNSLLQLGYNNAMLCLWKSKEISASYLIIFLTYLLHRKCRRYQTARCYSSTQHVNNAASFHVFSKKKLFDNMKANEHALV